MNRTIDLRTLAELVALAAGVALVADVSIITAIDRSFGLADSILFLIGFAGMFVLAALLALLMTRRSSGRRRVLQAAGIFTGLVASLTGISLLADAASHALYSGHNAGLHKECGILVLGVAALVFAIVLHFRAGRTTATCARPPRRPVAV